MGLFSGPDGSGPTKNPSATAHRRQLKDKSITVREITMALYVVKTKFSYGEETMIMPSTDPDTIFTELLQGLPIDIVEQAIEFKAFARSRKIKSATELLRVVLMFAGLDLTEREVAADL